MEKALFLAAFFFAYTVQAITGFAGNIFAMPVGTTLLGLAPTVAILNAMGFFACGLLAALNWRDIQWRELGKIVGTMMVFMVVGIWLDTLMPLHVLLKVYGAVIIAIGLKNLLVRQQKFLPEWALWAVLALAGLIQGMFVSGGALLVIYAVQKLRDRQQFRITLSATWGVLNLVYALIAHLIHDIDGVATILIDRFKQGNRVLNGFERQYDVFFAHLHIPCHLRHGGLSSQLIGEPLARLESLVCRISKGARNTDLVVVPQVAANLADNHRYGIG